MTSVETIKATVIDCSKCGFEQFFDPELKYKVCPSCQHVLVMRTASGAELAGIKKSLESQGMKKVDWAYSDYRTYSLTVEDVRELKRISREKKKARAEDVKSRKKHMPIKSW